MGLGDGLSQLLGTSNNFQSNVQAPDQSLYQLPNADRNRQLLQQQMAQNAGVQAPSVAGAQIDPSQQAGWRQQQVLLGSQLAQTAAGLGTSPADIQLQQGMQQSLAAQRAAAASAGGGVNPFLLQRQLAQGAAQAQQGMNGQLALQRAQETQQAQQALGGLIAQGRSTDLDLASQQAGLAQQANLANQGATLQQRQMNQQAQQFGDTSLMGLDQTQLGANMQYGGLQNATDQFNTSINSGVAAANQATGNQLVGGLLNAAGTAGAMALRPGGAGFTSDERLKTDVDRSHTGRQLDDFLGSLDVASYNYRRPEVDGAGRHFGVMAQSAARSEAGRSMIEDTPDGLKVSIPKGLSLTLASLGHLHRKQQATDQLIEKALKRVHR